MKQHAQNMDETTCCCSKYKIIHSYPQDEYKESNIPFDRHSPRTRILGNCKQLVFYPAKIQMAINICKISWLKRLNYYKFKIELL